MNILAVTRSIFAISGSIKPFLAPAFISAAATVLYVATYMLIAALLNVESKMSGLSILSGAAFMILAVLAYVFASKQARLLSALMSCGMVAEARLNLSEHLRQLPLSFFRKKDPGTITAYLLQDMVSVENIFSQFFVELVAVVVLPCMFAVFFFILDWRLALPLCLIFIIALPVLRLAKASTEKYGQEHIASRNKVFLYVLEYIAGISELRSCQVTGARFKPLAEALKKHRVSLMRFEVSSVVPVLVYSALLDCGFVLMLLVGMALLVADSLTLGVFVIFMVAGYKFYEPLQDMGAFLAELKGMGTAATRITAVMDEKPLPVPAFPATPKGSGVVFENVSFSYSADNSADCATQSAAVHSSEAANSILKNVSFVVPEGTVTALVGPSGSGKSTLCNLVARFWDVRQGAILLGGSDIRSIAPQELYDHISVVFQDVYLFHDTVMNNIRLGNPDATDEAIIDAAEAACCHDFIMRLPEGYQTVVGGIGGGLSGGERQRLSIARAILKNAPLVLLDEATSALDPENELAVQQALNNLLRDKTVIVIAHRLATIRDADQIVVLEKGTVVEKGTHEQLIALNGLYQSHWALQSTMEQWQLRSLQDTANGIR